ncbi:hypothetical protein IV500_06505 [Paeniglutamicibacter antarcticus]|uniref:Uncharacterized protein n=1 Tax=Arthrobacter terrae TaxID=2935737 RepID=A0A931CQA7_9MICC|nr:hypothetical protein [Arthrobacter terrae]MBG0739051.1 hypothetical protein [Arthrobacter terrae]
MRSQFIAYRENWREDAQRENLSDAASMARIVGEEYLRGRTVEQATADEWRLKVQRLALEVLHVHKAPLPLCKGVQQPKVSPDSAHRSRSPGRDWPAVTPFAEASKR